MFLQPELQYSLKGYGLKERTGPAKGPISLHYITVPLLAGVTLGKHLSVMAGPEFGYLVSNNAREKSGGFWGLNHYKDVDLGVDLGVTYKVNDAVDIALRYNHGLRDFMEGYLYDQYGQLVGHFKGVRNRVFQASVSYRLYRK